VIAFATASGVDQSTPFNNGAFTFGSGAPSLSITSASGDLTFDTVGQNSFVGFSSPTQTEKWRDSGYGGGSMGPGTGTTVHAWADPGVVWVQSGCNFVQAAVMSDSIGSHNPTSSPGRFIGWTA